MISVICVSNNERILRENLLASLSRQSAEYEFINVENLDGKYRSAAKALNSGAEKAKGKYLMFVHQDVVLKSDDFLEKAEKFMDSIPNIGIGGVAGRMDERGNLTNMTQGFPPKHAGHLRIDKPERVQTVDECLFIIPKTVFDRLKLDEEVCNDWHLYSVDYSLSAAKLGFEAYVLPLDLHHVSGGASMSKMYYRTLSKVARKHRDKFPWIHTTVGAWRSRIQISLQLLSIRLKRKMGMRKDVVRRDRTLQRGMR
jgi:GT2 family glycosyltransferase